MQKDRKAAVIQNEARTSVHRLTAHRCQHTNMRSLSFQVSVPPLLHVTIGKCGAKIVPIEKQAYTKMTKCAC